MIYVNGSNNAKACGLFNERLLNAFHGSVYAAPNFSDNGKMTFIYYLPHITQKVIEHFNNNNLKVSKFPVSGKDYYGVCFRGMITTDTILVPYPDDRLTKFDGSCECWLIDSVTNEIKAYKIVNFDDAFKDFLVNNETKMKDSGATESVVLDDMKKSVMPYSAKDLYRRSSPITTGRTALTAQDDFYYMYFNRSLLDLIA